LIGDLKAARLWSGGKLCLVTTAAVLGGCDVTVGGGETTTVSGPGETVTERTVKEPPPKPEPPPEPTGPYGVLGTEGVGPVTVGMAQEEVEELFGAAGRTETVNFGSGAAPQIDWIWSFDDGDLRLQFETDGDTLTGYRCDTAQLATSSGLSVGESFDPIAERYGDQLEEAPIGKGLYLLSGDEPGSYPALTFEVMDGIVRSISGGVPQAAGE
jgi:hypothetical protein